MRPTVPSRSCAAPYHPGFFILAPIGVVVCAVIVTAGCRTTKAESRADTASSLPFSNPAPKDEPALITLVDRNAYRAISERNLFRPLVVAPKSGTSVGAPLGSGKSGGSGSATKSQEGSIRPSAPPTPSDPTADLALTGIIETTDGLRALVEQISTRKGDFVGVGDQVFGFTVKSIEPGMVTLAQGPKTYVLRLGAKNIPDTTPSPSASSSAPPSSTGPPSQSSASPPSFTPPAGMPDFRNMSSEQRRQFFRDWWNRMPEEQRERFRSRGFGMGGFGGPRGGFNRGDRDR